LPRDLLRARRLAVSDPEVLGGEPVNCVLEVDLEGEGVTLTLYDCPSAGP
jgi:hypothetical protein